MTDSILSSVWVVIPAAGVGSRMEAEKPKQYLKIADRTIIEHTLACFINHPQVAGIIVALSSDDPYWKQLNIKQNKTPIFTVEGGKDRSDSVEQALVYLRMVERIDDDSWVMVHDAARPCVSQLDIDALLEIRSGESVGAILATPVRDTMKRSFPDQFRISHTESRENLWHALTPQLFKLGPLMKALEFCKTKSIAVTDEASAFEALGEHPELVKGGHENIKVTYPSDIQYASFLLKNKQKDS
ncbi:2-C-methyl-D-erythritol 4-phosphate cytidylyltransferase [uncultured Cocleimonas sp.]|uniref:2-C-methyl-D-erythritol 4-phosphate cytidylyltransferase n=1 Tax=uncultured Cocleimonas sp. TaxID=1051587 RepID=UPI0026097303|nr:2-C-methyl-D-erythritol 4-phosphate cytidylyltransferase [uncultured Cocleimonas sp.]